MPVDSIADPRLPWVAKWLSGKQAEACGDPVGGGIAGPRSAKTLRGRKQSMGHLGCGRPWEAQGS